MPDTQTGCHATNREELPNPSDHFALARAWQPVHELEEWVVHRRCHEPRALLNPLVLHASGHVRQHRQLLLIGTLLRVKI